MIEPIVLVHGGAGDIPDSRDEGKLIGCKLAVRRGYEKLQATESVVDAVEEAVRIMELDEHFNAGYGSVLTLDGNVEMEATIMEGKTLRAGCCTLVEDISHPISLARLVMDKTVHRFLGGKGVMRFAREQKVDILSPPGQLVTDYARQALEEFKKHLLEGHDGTNALTEIGKRDEGGVGTVGAIAIDSQGNVAAATSTGGITGKLPGRIGDTPILGAGNYADNMSGAVSATGYGEAIMQFNVAQRICQRLELLHENAQTATQHVLDEMKRRLTFTAGAITLDTSGRFGIYWNSEKMAWAYRKGTQIHSGIKVGQDFVEDA